MPSHIRRSLGMTGPNNTNVIILAIGGSKQARQMLEGKTIFLSVITEIELMSIPFKSVTDEILMRDFISNCFVIDLDFRVKNLTIELRKQFRVKTPDAIIAATALVNKLPFHTADRGFTKIKELNLCLFKLA